MTCPQECAKNDTKQNALTQLSLEIVSLSPIKKQDINQSREII